MTYSEIKNKINSHIEFGFTQEEAWTILRNSLKPQVKSNKLADKIAEAQQKNGTYQYGWTGKEYGNRKWGKQ